MFPMRSLLVLASTSAVAGVAAAGISEPVRVTLDGVAGARPGMTAAAVSAAWGVPVRPNYEVRPTCGTAEVKRPGIVAQAIGRVRRACVGAARRRLRLTRADVSRSPLATLNAANDQEAEMGERVETAILAGGCFWGMQDLFRRHPGVVSTRVGYSGGEVPNATYRNHKGHAESIEVVFDPEQTSYRELLEFFFRLHDPTTVNRQGNDIGTSYRSAIFYLDDDQRRVAEETIADVEASGRWPGKVVTEVSAAGPFWEAEPEHQDYLERYPNGYTCHFVRPEWVLPERATTPSA